MYTTRQIQAHLPFRTQKYLYVISQFYLILALSGIHVTIYSCPIRFLRHNLTGSLFRFVFPSFLCQMRPNRDIFISYCDSGYIYIFILVLDVQHIYFLSCRTISTFSHDTVSLPWPLLSGDKLLQHHLVMSMSRSAQTTPRRLGRI